MGLFNLRSLLIAVVVLCQCVNWTSSRHHFSHNVHRHRSRHRRQGAGLFLSSSFVLPGGEGSGGWGEWGEVSPCSRTCGGGVASQKRICLQMTPDGQTSCRGGDTKYISCQTQDCPDGSKDFRAEQCSEYDSVAFKGIRYTWVPYTKGPNPCELNCMPRGERFYYRQKSKVVDGTRCNEESFDVCVNGNCQPVGCDMMLGSTAREDKCRECRGNSANCYTTSKLLDTQDLRNGYNDILLIPQGATSIYIAEVRASSNYLAIRAKNNTYYLNGDYHIDFPRSIVIAGTTWHYERSQDGLPSPDKLRCQGPTDQPLFLSLLLQEPNVGVEYEYSVPSALAPPPNAQYNWVHEEFSPCSASCGGGIQTRNVTCRSREELEVVKDELCEAIVKPVASQSCNTDACPARWELGEWSPCSRHCGPGGTRSRQVHCEKVITNGYPSVVADKECFDLLGPKPPLFEECNKNATCPIWFTGPWKPCDKLCGEGKQTRQVVCYQKSGGRVEVLSDEQCADEKPAANQPCILHPCEGVDWVLSRWTGCDNCLSKVRTRTAACAMKDYKVVNDSLCAYHHVPVLEEACDATKLPPCEVQWYATQWSNCSAECGEGVQARRVFCGLFDGASVLRVDDERCAGSPRYNDTKPCEVPKDKCPSKWFAAPWSECTKECGGGEQYRRVMCLRGSAAVNDCDPDEVLDSTQACNLQVCNEDEILPVSPNSTPIMDECEEDEDYPEVGAEEDTGLGSAFTDEMMFSDSPFTSELESEFTTDTGSGDTLFTEGSGFGSTDSTFSTDEDWTTAETGSTDETIDSSTETENTSETGSTESDSTETDSTDSDSTDLSSVTEPTLVNASLPSDSTGSTETGATDSTAETEESSESSDYTDESAETGSAETTESGITESEQTTELGTTESGLTTESGSTDESTLSGVTESSDITDSTVSGASDETTVSGSTDSSGSTESSDYTDESTGSSETDYTDISTTETSNSTDETTETGSTESSATDETTETGSTEPEGSTEESSSGSTDLSEPTESSTAGGSTELGESESTTVSESTDVTTESGSTESSGSTKLSESTESGSTTEAGSTVSGSTDETTESGSTESSETELSGSTDETTESGTTEVSRSTETTESGSTESMESGATEATTETGSSEPSGSTEETGSTTESASEDTGSTETGSIGSTEETESTVTEETESTVTGESGATEESTSESSTETGEDSSGSTLWDWSSTIEEISKRPKCKRRSAKCTKSKFGCCPDKKTPAAGPFDEGCASPKTCAETKFGCCADGVSPAAGPKESGCPVAPCAETLFGCCKSDNKTAAEGNDQEGCPPPPPACKSSKYGCCSDEKTQATGPKKQGCPETAPKAAEGKAEGCSVSEFGCCFDNTTASPGPDGQGCPCNVTEFGCCPDGVSSAAGPQMEGCVMSCNSSAYGCCPDGETPAHGYDNEGCCLLYAFGCCPDNFKPAEGPHLEGCGCQYAHFGCCPDNATIARGPSYEGCGCDSTQHGCCPDRHTPATGPNFEGCDCATFQFGCCEDGVTAAKGPGRQGCLCQQTEFGCCGDEITPAAGPDQAGCDCSTSKHGCCPDGQTVAAGPKFLGCTDKPENRQAACSLSTDRGPCTNYSVLWYYDMEYGGCSRFWYGGCDGNGNRFASKEECEDVCVQPAPKDACQLPKVKGACVGYHPRWYFDSAREQCGQFIFGGCLGNANNFDTRELCEAQCEPAKSDNQCSLPLDNGPCAGNFPRWGFDGESRSCAQFVWGGCGGNTNRFRSEQACLHRCHPPGEPLPECNEPQDAGNCTEKQPAWSFSQSENRCLPFYYTGCGGTRNRFDSQRSCSETCPSSYVKDTCTLPALTGECAEYSEKWYYDTAIKRCRQFYYGGCGGNENRFTTQQECENQCSEKAVTTTARPPQTLTTVSANICTLPSASGECDDYTEKWFFDSSISRCRQFYYGGCGGNGNRFATEQACEARCQPAATQAPPTTVHGQESPTEICFLDIDAGPCTDIQPRWAYDTERGSCVPFGYGGCGGNQNNFPDEAYCQHICGAIQDICQLPMLQGPCEDSVMQWFYDPATDACSQFTYGGCQGNGNRFESVEACERRCRAGPEAPVAANATTTLAPAAELPPQCIVAPSADEECVEEGQVWYLDVSLRACTAHANAAAGRSCRRTGAYASEEACERACGAFRDIDVCRYPLDPGPCRGRIPKYHYDAALGTCEQFAYGGCHGGPNRFSTAQECQDTCKYEEDLCKRIPKQVNCIDYAVTWFFDAARDECFSYASCDLSDTDRFTTREQCEGQCRRALAVATTTSAPPPPEQPVVEECATPSSLAPCGGNVTVYYYDAERRECLSGQFGGCGAANAHRSEEECQRRCGAFQGLDPCRSPLDVGLCSDSIPKFYWKLSAGRCEQYAYSGCGGGPNRFSTRDECEQLCGPTGPEAACLEPVSVGEACGAPAQRRWHYSAAAGACRPFVYAGCGGTRNRFRSPHHCATACRTSPPEEGNEVLPDCDRYNEECAALRCEFGVQRTRTAGGCERCACVQVEVDCAPLRQECEDLKCAYGTERTLGSDGCERCTCLDHPCAHRACGAGERCVAAAYRDPVTQDLAYTADCHPVSKPGTCPSEATTVADGQCRRECNDDADCRGVGKCCERGCNQLCLAPAAAHQAPPSTTYSPELPQAPQANPQTEPEVTAAEGGKATLRCLFHGNPPPKITWRRGEITIDGDVGRYRLLSDGALEIVSLYRNDSGVYICVADNLHGQSRQEIRLQVNDPVEAPVGISGEGGALVTGELGRSLNIRCLAYGYPPPAIYWYRGRTMLPYSSEQYEARGNVLQIRRLSVDTLGEYSCQAYNGVGKAALWMVVVRAYETDDARSHELLVPRGDVTVPAREQTQGTTTLAPEIDVPVYTVPVNTSIPLASLTAAVGAELSIPCEVEGYPLPDVYWSKDGARLTPAPRLQPTEARLTISALTVEDSGVYGCHARNEYGSHSSTIQVNVQGLFIPPNCTDNPFFADCQLIVRSKFCHHQYYSKFCCKSCVEAGQLNPQALGTQADEAWKKK